MIQLFHNIKFVVSNFIKLMLKFLDWIIVIPARLNSKRLPNKPLLEIHGKTLIQRTYERALAAVNNKEKLLSLPIL